jgi:hypothetical protein
MFAHVTLRAVAEGSTVFHDAYARLYAVSDFRVLYLEGATATDQVPLLCSTFEL